MNAPSRRMPPAPAPQKTTVLAWIVLVAVIGALIWGLVASQPLRWALGGAIILLTVLTVLRQIRLKRVREERKDESICTFARTLPAKAHDTWVVRAVYEEVSRHVQAPIRPTDNVVKFWGIDGDDLDDAAFRIAHRTGRSMEGAQKNPLFGKVVTVADMIAFFEHQPRSLSAPATTTTLPASGS